MGLQRSDLGVGFDRLSCGVSTNEEGLAPLPSGLELPPLDHGLGVICAPQQTFMQPVKGNLMLHIQRLSKRAMGLRKVPRHGVSLCS